MSVVENVENYELWQQISDMNSGSKKLRELFPGLQATVQWCKGILLHSKVVASVEHNNNDRGIFSLTVLKKGIITQIIHLLEMVSLGDHFMEIVLLFREALFLNGILTNSEIWYGLSKSEINELRILIGNCRGKFCRFQFPPLRKLTIWSWGLSQLGW